MKKYILFPAFFCLLVASGFSQPTDGFTGLLNIPSASMQEDGTFMAGFNYLPEEISPERFNYNTANYYFNITFLPFFEVNYRLTLLQSHFTNGGYTEQDRTFGARLRVLKEKKYIPAVVLGADDIYTHTDKGSNMTFNAFYSVATKNFRWKQNQIALNLGCGFDIWDKKQVNGVFGGIAFTPQYNAVTVMAEYDSHAVNVGMSAVLLKHLYLYGFFHDFQSFAGGAALRIYLY